MISEDPAAGRAGSAPGGSSLAAVVSARLLRAGIDPYGPELAFIHAWNANIRALRGGSINRLGLPSSQPERPRE